jgi:hypothetical protein
MYLWFKKLYHVHIHYKLLAFTIQEQEIVSIMVLQGWQSHFDLWTMVLVWNKMGNMLYASNGHTI